jgi:preprotein translocase subunit SecF
MKQIFILSLCVFFVLIISANAGELYHCIDLNGNSIITDTPQDGMTNCVLKESYDDPMSQQRAQQQRETQSQRSRSQSEDQIETQGRQQEANQGKSRVDLEKKRLENNKEAFGSMSEGKKVPDKRTEQLEKDPDKYLYDKEQRDKDAASTTQHEDVINPTRGGANRHY